MKTMTKEITKYITYFPEESIEIHAVKGDWQKWYLFAIVVFIIFLIVLSSFLGAGTGVLFVFAFSTGIITMFFNALRGVNSFIQFTTRRVAVRLQHDNPETETAFFLKSPTALDIIIKQQTKKQLLEVSFEQYGELMGTTTVQVEDLTYLLDSLNDLLGLEVQESRSTSTKEEILYLRPVGSDNNLMPSYIKIVDSPLRLIVNPSSNDRNFIVNYQRNIIKTAYGQTYNLDDFQRITLKIIGTEIGMYAWSVSKNEAINIINFKTKSYSLEIIMQDLQRFVGFLKTKSSLQHIQFEIKS